MFDALRLYLFFYLNDMVKICVSQNIAEIAVSCSDSLRKTQKYSVFSKCLLRHGLVPVFVSFCVLVFVRAILSWCP